MLIRGEKSRETLKKCFKIYLCTLTQHHDLIFVFPLFKTFKILIIKQYVKISTIIPIDINRFSNAKFILPVNKNLFKPISILYKYTNPRSRFTYLAFIKQQSHFKILILIYRLSLRLHTKIPSTCHLILLRVVVVTADVTGCPQNHIPQKNLCFSIINGNYLWYQHQLTLNYRS